MLITLHRSKNISRISYDKSDSNLTLSDFLESIQFQAFLYAGASGGQDN